MDNSEVQIPPAENIDVEMEETREPVEQQKDGTGEPVEQQQDAESTQDATVVTTQDDSVAVQEKNEGLKFIDHLKSPVVELVVGQGDDQTVLTAHEGFLKESPFFSEAVAAFKDGEAFQYTGDYFPRRLQTPGGGLEHDPTAPDVDDTGDQLLKHARVYTLAEKLGVPALKTLAHSKIHRISSTARGEIAYARYVYANTSADDVVIRKPIAAFWATRSHVLRHEAEMEFRTMCLEFPQFGFDVLSLVLDQKEKRSQDKADADSTVKGSARKRPRSGL
ncbi:hypothetical protein DTO195F2_5308 [Paecilomyces variotii]|nr:hypothetical protein DTO195F2_5308 [Paecilomyces variotii]